MSTVQRQPVEDLIRELHPNATDEQVADLATAMRHATQVEPGDCDCWMHTWIITEHATGAVDGPDEEAP